MSADLPPVQHTLEVPLAVEQAFALFVDDMASWWPFSSHSCAGDEACAVHFEPRVGGSVTELTRSGQRHPWGTLTAWAPPTHLAMTWHPAQAPEQATQLTVRFAAVEGGCRIHLLHGGWSACGAEAAPVRDNYHQGWALVLGLYAAAAAKRG
jgi:hypothetical protein